MIYVFSGGYQSEYEFLKTYKSKKEFLTAFSKMTKNDKESIELIVQGKELNVKAKVKEVIREWTLE